MLDRRRQLSVTAKMVASFALIIVMFSGALAMSTLFHGRANDLHIYRSVFISARSKLLMEFRANFSDMRLLISAYMVFPEMMREMDDEQLLEYRAEISNVHSELRRVADLYLGLTRDDPLLDEAYARDMTAIMGALMSRADVIRDSLAVPGATLLEPREIAFHAVAMEEGLGLLMGMADRRGEEILLEIDGIVGRTGRIVLAIAALVVAAAVALAWRMVRAHRVSMAIWAKAVEREREANEMNEIYLSSAPFGISLLDEDANILDVSQHTVNMFGAADRKEYLERYREFWPERQPCGAPSSEKVVSVIKEAFRGGYAKCEWMRVTATGEPLPIETTFVRFNRQGRNMLVAYLLDLREVKAAAAREREAHETTQMLLDSAPFSIVIWSSAFSIVGGNMRAGEMFGLSGVLEFSERFHELSPEFQPCGTPSREKARACLEEALSKGHCRFEWQHRLPSGEPLPAEITLARFARGGGTMIAAYTIDLREIRAAMSAASDAERRAAALVEAMPTACYLLDADMNKVWCNQIAVELFAKGPEARVEVAGAEGRAPQVCRFECGSCELLGRDFCLARKLIVENPSLTIPDGEGREEETRAFMASACARALADGKHRFEMDHSTLGGEVFPAEVTIVPINYLGRAGYACYVRDMRGERRREIAEEESRAKSMFLARMSHEIRTPMNAVLGIAEIQLQKDGLPPGVEEAFLRIQNSSSMLLAIINDILDLSKVEAGKMEIAAETYEVASMIVDTMQLNVMRVGSRSIDLRLEADERLPTHLIGDEIRIKQVMNNVLSNALKYTDEGSVTLSVRAEESPAAGMVTLAMRVSDTGQGMTREQLDGLFNLEFTRFNLHSNRAIEGTGLGMNIARQIVDMMGGEIFAESEPGKGSVFTVRVPQKLGSVGEIGAELARSLGNFEVSQKSLRKMLKQAHIPMPYGRVLVVDDVESNLYVVKGILRPYKIAAETATCGRQAVDRILAGEVYDVIFMDHMMPDMDGIEAVRLMREAGYRHPIVALTANTIKGVQETFLSSGFDAFVAKPIDLNKFNSYLVRYVRDKQPPEVIEAAERNRVGGEAAEDLRDNLRESFLLDARKAAGELDSLARGAEADGEWLRSVVAQAHAMKSALFNIGRHGLSKAALELETAGRAADARAARALAPRFLEELRAVIAELSPEDRGEDGDDEDVEFMTARLEEMAQACERFDPDAANAALEELEGKRCSKGTKERLKEISAHLLYGDFDEAAALAIRAASALRFLRSVRQEPAQ